MFWAYGSYVGGRLLSLLATAILARLLVPQEFGIVALALTAMAFLDMLQGLGVSEALVIARAGEVEEQAETAFAVSVLVGFVLAGTTAALGPAAAAFFHQPKLVVVMPVLGINFLLLGLGSTHAALAQRNIDFRSRTVAEFADVVIRGAISVALALAGAGVWSLVIGYAVGTAAWTVTIWYRVPWRPRLRPTRRHLSTLMRFGGALTGVAIMAAFLTQFDNLVIGRVLGATQLGFYSMATRLPYLFIVSLAVVAGRVLYPALAALDRDDMGRGFLTSLRYTAMVALPLTAYMAIFARPMTIGLFGDKWLPAVTAAQVLCVWALMSPITMVCGNALKAHGRADLLLKLAIPQAVALVVGSLVLVKQGIVAISWLQAGIAVASQLATLAVTQRLLGLQIGDVLGALRPPVLAAGLLAIPLFAIERAIREPWPAIAAGAATGTVLFVVLLALLTPDTVRRLRTMARAGTDAPEAQVELIPIDPLDEVRPRVT
jgi:PST family polysaccharide transporter